MEKWKDIPNYEGLYQASNLGNIRSVDKQINTGNGFKRTIKGHLISVRLDSSKRCFLVDLYKHGNSKTRLVHRVIASTFIGSCEGLEINHLNGNPKDNRVENLEITTRGENEKHKYRVLKIPHPFLGRRGERHARSLPVLQIDPNTQTIVKEFASARLAESEGFINSSISLCCNGKQQLHKGYLWKFKTL